MSMIVDPVKYSTESKTKQSMQRECDINHIVAKANKGQAITHLAKGVPSFMDVSDVGDYKGALDMLRSADAFFGALPSKVRFAFDNDPAAFLDAVDTVDGRAKLEAAGLVPPAPAPVIPVVPPVVAPVVPAVP